MSNNDNFKFSLILLDEFDQENDMAIGYFNSVDGLEVPDNLQDEDRELIFYDGVLNKQFNYNKKKHGHHVKLYFLGLDGVAMCVIDGAIETLLIQNISNKPEVILTGYALPSILPGSLSLLNGRRNGKPERSGEWLYLSPSHKKAWFEVAVLCSKPMTIDRKDVQVQLDGNNISDKVSFLCELGEAIHGPGGYFGRDLDGLIDCLTGGFGIKTPMKIVWKNASASMINFAAHGKIQEYNTILSLLEKFEVLVELE